MARTSTDSNFLAIAAKKCVVAQDLPVHPKILFYSKNKKGKSTLALSGGRDETLVLDPEEGVGWKKQLNPFIYPIERWRDMNDAYNALRTGKFTPNHIKQGESSTPFKYVAVDGMTRINNVALKFVMKTEEKKNLDRQPGFVQQRDYGKSGELMKEMLIQFHTLKMGVFYTAQERMRVFDSGDSEEDEETTFFIPDLPDAVRGAVNSWVDVIGRLYVVKVENKKDPMGTMKDQRRLQVGISPRYDTGYRSEFLLPDVINYPTIPKILNLMAEGAK